MSANDYYNTHAQRPQEQYYQSYNPSAPSLPPYQSQASSVYHSQRPAPAPPSPFETPFDDHVYPAADSTSYKMDSQSTLGQDSRHYGNQGRRPQDSQSSFADNIPLKDHPGKPGMDNDSTDHVYDAPLAPPKLMEEGRNKRRTSGLGKYTQPKKRIAWVVYALTLVQVGVFIGEIVKNGMDPFSILCYDANFNQPYSPNLLSKSTPLLIP
jgi:hypothetical protein